MEGAYQIPKEAISEGPRVMLAEACVRTAENQGGPWSGERAAPSLLLASRSPRRRTLLTDAGISHEAEHPGFEDGVLKPGHVSPSAWVMSLAFLKAWAKARTLTQRRTVMGADTTCVLKGNMLGTPRDADEAGSMLRAFRRGPHEVITGVALVESTTGRRRLFADRAVVTFGELADADIDTYVASGEWQGKAGAYNLAERLSAGWPITFQGDASTIMGLPMGVLSRELEQFRTGGTGACG